MRTEECNSTLEKMLDYLDDPAGHPEAADQALAHLTTCSHCQEQVRFLKAALAVEGEDTLTCGDCQAELPALVQAQVMEESYLREVVMERHLALCPHCTTQYAELLSLTEMAYAGEFKGPSRYPTPDLAFLPERSFSTHVDAVGRLVVDFYEGLLQALNPPAAQPALVTVRDRDTRVTEIGSLSVEDEDSALRVNITVYAEPDNPDRCRIVAEVQIAGRGWPDLAGTQVVMHTTGEEPQHKETDPFGKAYFEDVPLKSLEQASFEIASSLA